MAEPLLYEVRNRIAYITLNRPQQLNAITNVMRRRWAEAIAAFNEDTEPLVLIVRGAGDRAFSSGRDLKEAAQQDAPDADVDQSPREPGKGEPRLVQDIQKPAIAAINGYCVAGGLEIALMCDIRIATPKSQFGLPEPRWGLPGGYGLHMLSRTIPLGEALYMQLTGERIGAERAYQIGLIQKLVPEEKLLEEAEKVAGAILLCSPLAVQTIKNIVKTCRDLPLDYSFRFAREALSALVNSEDFKEGPRAFVERRKPVWKGR